MKTIWIVHYGRGGQERCRSKSELAHFIAYAVESGYKTFTVEKQSVPRKRRTGK